MLLWVHLTKSVQASIKSSGIHLLVLKNSGGFFTTHVLSPSFLTVLIPFCYENSLLSLRKQLAKSLRHPAERTARLESCSVFLIDPFVSSSFCPFVLQLKRYINKVWSDFLILSLAIFDLALIFLFWCDIIWVDAFEPIHLPRIEKCNTAQNRLEEG